jgi:polyhydroxyalkanoate synthesis regulator protein
MAMFEQAMSMWASFGAAASGPRSGKGEEGSATPGAAVPSASAELASGRDELTELKSQLSAMQQKIEKLSQSRP